MRNAILGALVAAGHGKKVKLSDLMPYNVDREVAAENAAKVQVARAKAGFEYMHRKTNQ